jgi:hypothetical protein
MKCKYTQYCKRLDVFGTDSQKDMRAVKKLIADKKIPSEINAIVYRKAKNSTVAMILRGPYLTNFLKSENSPVKAPIPPLPQRASLKDIFDQIKQINDVNTRQATYSGILLYCTSTKRFLFFTPRSRGRLVSLLGDNPIDNETPPETIHRVTKEDGGFEVPPTSLIPLIPLEIDGTTYYTYLCFINHEFKPNLSDRLISSTWEDYTKLDDLQLHQSVSHLFSRDKKLKKLTKPSDILDDLDFDKLINDILHSA